MSSKIKKMVEKLSDSEKEELSAYIEKHYAVDFEGVGMRDDIRDKIIEMIKINFDYVDKEIVKEEDLLKEDLDIDSLDSVEFSLYIEDEFDIEFISPDDISKWKTVKDIIDFIENNLEEAVE